MKLLTSILSLFSMAYVAMAHSESFFLQSVRTGSTIHNSPISVDGNDLVINGQQAVGGRISDDGLFWIGFQYVGLGPNSEVVLVDDKANALGGWFIKGGYVSNNQGTYAVPNGDGSYKLFFGTTQDQNNIPFAIMGLSTANDGSYVADFTPSQEPAPQSVSSGAATTTLSPSASPSAPAPQASGSDSESFYLHVVRTGSQIHNDGISADGNNLVIHDQNGVSAVITQDGYLKVGEKFVGIGPNSEMVLVDDKATALSGWSITNGYVSTSQSYFAVPTDNGYKVVFGTTQDQNNIPFAIIPISTATGQTVADFKPSGQPTTSSAPAPQTTSSAPAPQTTSSAPAPQTTSTAPAPAPTTSSAPVVVQTENGAAGKSMGLGAILVAMGAFLI